MMNISQYSPDAQSECYIVRDSSEKTKNIPIVVIPYQATHASGHRDVLSPWLWSYITSSDSIQRNICHPLFSLQHLYKLPHVWMMRGHS